MNFIIANKEPHRIIGTTKSNTLDSMPEFMRDKYHYEKVEDYLKDCETLEDKIFKMFDGANAYWDWYKPDVNSDDAVTVEINNGDWKHDHLFCDDLMEAIDFGLEEEILINDSDSDCYSANRIYKRKKA